ncbi:MAG: preprotein translocase subunit YajC [Clostridia bacterium]|nr:preprotein translocase subunit YajC [Clostridia bacterium]
MEVLMIVAMFAIFYFMLIRPQRKRDKETKMMLEALQMGDKVMTHGGIYGKIVQLKEDTVIIETGATGNTSTIKIARTAIGKVLTIKD